MADLYVRSYIGPVFTAAVASGVLPGSLVYHDGTRFALADADAIGSPAQYICIGTDQYGGNDKRGTLCRRAIIEDTDAPYTLGDIQYTSTTAGAITATRPTGANDLRQVVGRAISTSQLEIEIRQPFEVTVQPDIVAGNQTDPLGGATSQLDSGNYFGGMTNAQNEVIGYTLMVPENAIAIVIAYLWLAAEATAGTPTFDMFVSSSNDGDQWDAVTQDSTIADSADEGAAADEIQRTDVTTAFDATDILHPGKLLGVRILKKDSGTDITQKYNLAVIFRCC